MSAARAGAARGYLRFLAWTVAVTAAVALLGVVPTRRLAGGDAIPALLAGCAIGILASALGALPVALARRDRPPAARAQTVLAAMALRLGAALVLALAAALSGWFARRPLLLWVAVSYLAQLVIDTRYALGVLHDD
jgi:hypothetical protein